VGVTGRDEPGKRLLDSFRDMGISTDGIRAENGYETPTKSRILAGGVHTRRQQLVRVDRGTAHGSLEKTATAALASRLKKILTRAEGLLVADYGYGAATPELVARATGRRKTGALPATVDSRSRITSYRKLSACTPNQEELENALGLDGIPDERSMEEAGRLLLRKTGHRAVLVTRGARGMCLFERRRPTVMIPAFGSDEVADVTGAGDTVIATFTLALVCGADHHAAALLANYAAGLVVMKAGTATVGVEELHEAVQEGAAS
jgi:rfaE bifunctional protein kinase chain/domain